MAYGKGFFKRRSSFRTGNRVGRYRRATRTQMAYRAKRAIARRLNRPEIKYADDHRRVGSWDYDIEPGLSQGTFNYEPSFSDFWLSGHSHAVKGSALYARFGVSPSTFGALPQWDTVSNCLSVLGKGASADQRIGNKVSPRYITVQGIVTAAGYRILPGAHNQDGETSGMQNINTFTMGDNVARFVRTALKIVIVRDKDMNKNGFVEYEDVFKLNNEVPRTCWVRNLDNISRFEILKEVTFNLDQDDPQKSFRFVIPLKGKVVSYSGKVVEPKIVELTTEHPLMDSVGGTIPVVDSGTDTGLYKSYVYFHQMQNGIFILMAGTILGGTNYDLSGNDSIAPETVYTSRMSFYDQ